MDTGSSERISLPFEDDPCQCVGRHVPAPMRVERHHVYPQAEQIKCHGKVVDKTLVSLCDTSHASVHIAMSKTLKGEFFRLGNRYLQAIVDDGVSRIRGCSHSSDS